MPKYRSLKTRLHKICNNKQYRNTIQDAVNRVNRIAIDCMQFIKLYVLYQYHNSEVIDDSNVEDKYKDIPTLDGNFIMKVIDVITEKESERGPPVKKNLKLVEVLTSFYDSHFAVLSPHIQKVKTTHLRTSLMYLAQMLEVNYTNNIVMHFLKHLRRYITTYVENIYRSEEGIDKYTKLNSDQKKTIRKLGWTVYQDFINTKSAMESDNKYHSWIKQKKNLLLPKRKDGLSIMTHLNKNPFTYLKYMIALNLELEKMEVKLFQPLCLRNNITVKYIKLDSQTITHLLADCVDLEAICIESNISPDGIRKRNFFQNHFKHITDKRTQQISAGNFRTNIWKHFFQLNKQFLTGTQYQFANSILTDGYGVSILQVKHEHFGKGILGPKEKKDWKHIEFPYLDEMSEEEVKYIKEECTIIGCDPGKVNLLQFIKEGENVKPIKLKYTTAQRHYELDKQKKTIVRSKLKKSKYQVGNETKTVKQIENGIEYNSKTCDLEKFKEYIREKQEINVILTPFYQNKVFRKMKWDTNIKSNSSEDKLLDRIEKTFREKTEDGSSYKPIAIAYGDWEQKRQLRNFVPTKGVGLKRKIAQRFKIVNTQEYMTSQTCHNCHEKAERFIKRKNKKNKETLVRGVLRCKNVSCRIHWDRDINGALNILQNLTYQLNGVKDNPFIRPNKE